MLLCGQPIRWISCEPRSEDETGLIQDYALISLYFEGFDQILEEILDLEGLWNKTFSGNPVLKTYGKQRTSELKARKKNPHLHPIPIMTGWVDGEVSDFTKEFKDSPYVKFTGWRK